MLMPVNAAVSSSDSPTIRPTSVFLLFDGSELKLLQPLRASVDNLGLSGWGLPCIRGVRFRDGTVSSNYSEAPAPVKIPCVSRTVQDWQEELQRRSLQRTH